MKPRVKNDSWCYTATKTSARQRVKRLRAKRHRQEDKKVIGRASALPEFLYRNVLPFSVHTSYRAAQSRANP
jgi:hypothetical protein